MKKYLLFPLCAALCLLAGCADDFPTELNHNYYQDDTPPAEPDITEQTVKLGTYNLWISNKGTGDYVWTHRRDILAQSIVNNDWDIFGFQEANSTIQSELPTLVAGKGGNYEWWFVGRDSQDGKNGEALGIAYDPDRFELSDRHYFWLSPTPDEMSYGWDEVSYHRIACCAVVTDKAYGKQFFMMVTHMPLADMARSEAAKVIIEREQMYNTLGMPSVLVGRHECHAGRRRFGDVPHPLGGRLSGDGSGVRRRSRRHVQRAQDLDRPFGLDGPHRLHLHARSAVAENL